MVAADAVVDEGVAPGGEGGGGCLEMMVGVGVNAEGGGGEVGAVVLVVLVLLRRLRKVGALVGGGGGGAKEAARGESDLK